SDLNHMHDCSRRRAKADQMPSEGYGLAQTDPSQAPRIFKGLFVKPDDSSKVAIETDDRRPLLDEITINTARDTYLRRWDRAHAAGWLGTKPPAVPTTPVPATDTASTDSSQRTVQRLDQMDLAGAAEKAKARRRELEERNRRRNASRQADEEFDAIVSDLTPPNGGQVPRLLEVALEQSTDRGVHYSVLEETTRLPGPRIRELMSLIGLPPVDATFRMHPGTDSPKKRGYRRGDLDRVAAEIALGDVQVPTEVRDAL